MTSSLRVDEPHLFDEPSIAHALRVILVAMLISALAISAVTLFLKWRLTPQLALVAGASSLVALMLSGSGRTRPAMFLPLVTITYVVLHLAARSDGIQNVGLAILPVLIMVGSLVLNRLALVLFTTGAILAVLGMLAIRYFVLQAERYSANDMGDLFIFAVTCAGAALVGRLLAVRIEEGFRLLRASESRYRGIFENVQDVYYEIDRGGVVLELSPAGTALFGVPPEEMIGRPLTTFCVNESDFEVLLATLRRQGQVSNRELVIRDSGGAFRHVLVNASFETGSHNGGGRVIGSIRDITERKRAEEALRESEARLRLALDAAGAGTFDFHPESGELMCSDITKAHFGISPQTEPDYDLFLRAVHPDDLGRVRQLGNSLAFAGSSGQFAIEHRTVPAEDGTERWIGVRGRMLVDAENRPSRLIGITVNISERKRLEEELRRRAEELQTIMDVAPVALFVAKDPECREVSGNQMAHGLAAAAEGMNISLSAPQGAALPLRFSRGGVEVPAQELPLQLAARGAEVRDCELEVLVPNGSRRLLWGHASPLRDAGGRVRGAIAAFQDVTAARQHTDALLRESEERFRNTADASPVIMWLGDTQKGLSFVNKQMTVFTGIPAEKLLGDGWLEAIHPDDLDQARSVYDEGVDRQASLQIEYRARRADGVYRHMLGTTSPRYIGRQYAGQVGSVIDITDLKRQQQEDLARQKWESLGTLAGGIAHDFNNLLGGILSQTELALAELAGGGSADAEIHSIQAVAIRGAEIVRQLLVYAGQNEDTIEPVNVSRLIEESLDLLKVVVSKHAVLELRLAADVPVVRSNVGMLRQILINLATNASEAIGERAGVIQVSTSRVSIDSRSIPEGGGLLAGHYLQLEISDTGCGIPAEKQAKIFDPFFTTKSPGRGLGLAVVQGIVRRLGGAITVRSAHPGSVFQILLPGAVEPSREGSRDRADAEEKRGSARGTVLIVEDEEIQRSAISKMLRKEGFTVLEAPTGSEALAMLEIHAAELRVMLLDVTLPGVGSPEIFREARRLCPDLTVIVTSAYSEQTVAPMFADLPHRFLRKPFRITDLLQLLGSSLD